MSWLGHMLVFMSRNDDRMKGQGQLSIKFRSTWSISTEVSFKIYFNHRSKWRRGLTIWGRGEGVRWVLAPMAATASTFVTVVPSLGLILPDYPKYISSKPHTRRLLSSPSSYFLPQWSFDRLYPFLPIVHPTAPPPPPLFMSVISFSLLVMNGCPFVWVSAGSPEEVCISRINISLV